MRIVPICCQFLGISGLQRPLPPPQVCLTCASLESANRTPHLVHLGPHRRPKWAKNGPKIKKLSARADKNPNSVQSISPRGLKFCLELIKYSLKPLPFWSLPLPHRMKLMLLYIWLCSLCWIWPKILATWCQPLGVVNPQRHLESTEHA